MEQTRSRSSRLNAPPAQKTSCRHAGFLLVSFALLTASCGRLTGEQASPAPGESEDLPPVEAISIADGPVVPPLPFITNHVLTGGVIERDAALSAPASGGLMGWLSPVAVPSPDGTLVAYNAFRWYGGFDFEQSWSSQGVKDGQAVALPSIRVLNVVTGEDLALIDGAFSIAWRSDGTIAYFRGAGTGEYRVNTPYLGTVEVRASQDAAPSLWVSDPGSYVVLAWAGSTLLVYDRTVAGDHDLLAVDGPGDVRVLQAGGELIAISPDGKRALVYSSVTRSLALLDVGAGKPLASLDLGSIRNPTTGLEAQYVAYGGDWLADTVAAEAGSGVVLLHVDDTIRVIDLLSFPTDAYPMPVHEPRFVDESTERVVVWAPIPGKGGEANDRLYVYLDCDVSAASCLQGPPRTDQVFFAATNPSRPMPGVS